MKSLRALWFFCIAVGVIGVSAQTVGPYFFGVIQTNSTKPGLLVQEAIPPTNADLIDVLGFGQSPCAGAPQNGSSIEGANATVSLCINPSPNPSTAPGTTESLDVYNRSTVGCGICLRTLANGDGLFEALGPTGNTGYGIDMVNYNASNTNPFLVANNCGCGTGGQQVANPNFGVIFIRDRNTGGSSSLDVEDQRASGAVFSVNQSVSTDAETVLFANMAQSGGTFTGNFLDFKQNGTDVFRVDSNGNVIGGGTLTANNISCGVANTTNCTFNLQTGGTTSTSLIFDTSSGCAVNSNHVYRWRINGTEEDAFDCLGSFYIGGRMMQEAANATAGTCTMSAGTTCTFSLLAGHGTFTTPMCFTTDQGAAIAGTCSISGTTVTVTAASSNSNTWAAFLMGNPT